MPRRLLRAALALFALSPLARATNAQDMGAAAGSALPRHYAGPPTVADITPGDLMTRLYIFADDSMMGRRVGTIYNDKGTAYIEREVRRLGLLPAGDNGTYFQKLPVGNRALDSTSTLTVDGTTFTVGADFVARATGTPRTLGALEVVFAGRALDTTDVLPPEALRGKLVLLTPGALPPGSNVGEFVQSEGFRRYEAALEGAAAIAAGVGDQLPDNLVRALVHPTSEGLFSTDTQPVTISLTNRVADAILGAPVSQAKKGQAGRAIIADVRFVEHLVPGRNVVAILPGSDPALTGEYVAIGAHNDHIGFNRRPVDHDSIRVFDEVVRPQGEDSPRRQATADEAARVRLLLDSLRALPGHEPRPDSIYNGADDDGSGSVSVLEIAEAFARGKDRPRRSILFIWHAGEEEGLWGSEYFTDHPTVPRDSIVAELNMDMVGRGGASDVTGEDKSGGLLHGGSGYLQLVGSRRLSTELGDLIEKVNMDRQLGFHFDYALDADGHPQSIYCRSDHYEYARYGIPIVFFTTGGHSDYHQVTDEPQYIDYDRMARVSRLVHAAAVSVADLDHRVVVDKPKPDPKGNCVQ